MSTTFLKRQKEMKRLEKQREKAERRRQKKLAKRTGGDGLLDGEIAAQSDLESADLAETAASEPEK